MMASSAHPRSRGENWEGRVVGDGEFGSSPLTRGKQVRRPWRRWMPGLIPAHAGKTPPTSATCSLTKAHPRSRGENRKPRRIILMIHGSSPLTRGKRARNDRPHPGPGLIPAHAGKTSSIRYIASADTAHPRSRGENRHAATPQPIEWGSSPLTRGKPGPQVAAACGSRLIPAHAGKTNGRGGGPGGHAAHPRSRGENRRHVHHHDQDPGSSPLTRGKPLPTRSPVRTRRLIPAHAGKTSSPSAHAVGATAHPRSRGENDWNPVGVAASHGSSPLTRGKQHAEGWEAGGARLIPAHAGKTRARRRRRRPHPAHPRSRGENAASPACLPRAAGSSPLTRGKPHHLNARGTFWGLIPAHAGKTRAWPYAATPTGAHPRSRGENVMMTSGAGMRSGSSPLTRGKQSHGPRRLR